MTRAARELPATQATRSASWIALPLLLGAFVSLTVGLLAREEAVAPGTYPGGYFRLFFSDSLHLKVWFATAALVLGGTQLFTAAWIFGKLSWRRPPFVPAVHRWLGRLAFACTLPVAYHCIFKLGFQTTSDRVVAHSLLGCAFYGTFAAEVTIVRLHRYPRWVLPTAGGLLFAALLGVWYTSALWLFRTIGVGI